MQVVVELAVLAVVTVLILAGLVVVILKALDWHTERSDWGQG